MKSELTGKTLVKQPLQQVSLFGNDCQHFHRLFFQVVDNGFFQVHIMPEMVAMFHLKKVGAKLTEMSKEQSDYIGVEQQGPFKKETYRY